MSERLEEELRLLRSWFGEDLDYAPNGHWVRISSYEIPFDVWSPRVVAVAFQVPARIPGQAPYGFWVSPGIGRTDGQAVLNYTFPDPAPPFDGPWGKFSWQLPDWRPGAMPQDGSSMLDFARSIASRFGDGP